MYCPRSTGFPEPTGGLHISSGSRTSLNHVVITPPVNKPWRNAGFELCVFFQWLSVLKDYVLFSVFHLILSVISSFCIITTAKRSLRTSFLLFLSLVVGGGRCLPPAGSRVIKTAYHLISSGEAKCFAAAVLLWPRNFVGRSLVSDSCLTWRNSSKISKAAKLSITSVKCQRGRNKTRTFIQMDETLLSCFCWFFQI